MYLVSNNNVILALIYICAS